MDIGYKGQRVILGGRDGEGSEGEVGEWQNNNNTDEEDHLLRLFISSHLLKSKGKKYVEKTTNMVGR